MSILRIIALIVGLSLLSGCNLVVSKEPWFTDANTTDAPRFRDGLWTSTLSANCKFDPASDPSTWPDCALAAKVKDNRWSSLESERSKNSDSKIFVWKDIETIIVGGDPTIIQFKTDPQGLSNPSEQYVYLAAQPTERDVQGNVVAFSAWAVFCGPVDRRAKRNSEESVVTKKPFDGLSMTSDYNCTANDADAVRNAARQSEHLVMNEKQQQTLLRWVRD